MTKRLILILALAFVVGLTVAAYAEVQNVKVSGDLTVYGIMRQINLNTGNDIVGSVDGTREQALASITRVRVDADLTDNVSTTVRLLNERYWGREDTNNDASGVNTDIDLDLAYVTLKEFLYSPLTLTIGRQELHFGNGMIVGDPDTNGLASTASAFTTTATGLSNDADLSSRKAFDAIRATLNYDPLVIDIITAKIRERDIRVQDDEDLYGVNVNYALTKRTMVEGYYFGRHLINDGAVVVATATTPALVNHKTHRTDTVGGRVVTKPVDNLTFQLEGAYQFGKAVGQNDFPADSLNTAPSRRAWAWETALTWDIPKLKYNPSITALYAYFTGNKSSDRKRWRAWDSMYEDQKFGDIANAQFPQSNAHIAGAILAMKPMEDIGLKGEYYAFWWDKRYGDAQTITSLRGDNVIMKHKKFAGQELDITATYDYTEDVQFSLLSGLYFPGSSFADNNGNIGNELIGKMKVTF
jgi:hypothetical protein